MTHASAYVGANTVATTNTATGLAPGNYYWRYRLVGSGGAATAWGAAGNPDFIVDVPTTPPTAASSYSQVNATTGAIIPQGGAIALGTGVFFRVTIGSTGSAPTARLEVELRTSNGPWTGMTHSSPYVGANAIATTTTATGLLSGNYYWRYRLVGSGGAATTWGAAGNPDFMVTSPGGTPPIAASACEQVNAATNAVIPPGGSVAQGTGVDFRVTIGSTGSAATARLEIELRPTNGPWTGATHFSPSVSSSSVATSSATGLGPGNYYWRYRLVGSTGAATAWGGSGSLGFIVTSAATPTAASAYSQVNATTNLAIPSGGYIAQGVGVYFRVTIASTGSASTARLEVELRSTNGPWSGLTHSSPYVAANTVATTNTAFGLTPGPYFWRYRLVGSGGLATAWGAPGNPDFVVSCAASPTTFQWPMSGTITTACDSQHPGVDISSAIATLPLGQVDVDGNGYPEVRGAQVFAAAAGTVSELEVGFPQCRPNNACASPPQHCPGAANGNFVRILHANGYSSVYAHLFDVAPGLVRGVCVRAGDPIGHEGNTGSVCQRAGSTSLGKHLHWALQYQGNYVCVDGRPQDPVVALGTAAWIAGFGFHGAGCVGANGIPNLTAVSGMPRPGTTFQVRFGNLPTTPSPIGVFAALGIGDQTWNAQRLPLDMGSYGLPGCMLRIDPSATLVLTNVGGRADWGIQMPSSQALLGSEFFLQGAVPSPGANAAALVMSDSGRGVLGNL